MRLVKSVAGELLHQIEDLVDRGLGMTQRRRAAHKSIALLGHRLCVLLSHRAAQQVRFAKRVARQHVGDPHYLFLVNDHAQRIFQNPFKLRQQILHVAPSPLALDEVIDHVHRPGPVERIQLRQLFHRVRLVAPQNVAHPARLKLEHARSQRRMKHPLERLRIVERESSRCRAFSPRVCSISFTAIVDDRQRRRGRGSPS